MTYKTQHLTEKQLEQVIDDLEKQMQKGEGTECTANRLAEYRRQLRRINEVKYRREY